MEYEIVDRNVDKFRGTAWLVQFDEPVTIEEFSGSVVTNHIAISAVRAPFDGPETYIFPADETGEPTSWAEAPGSFKGDLDHSRALDNFLGYMDEDGVVSRNY